MISLPKFYITTAIPYVNAKPHIGFALECVQADVIARYRKINGASVWLTTGADENSLKNVQAAEKLGISTEKLCETNAALFRTLADKIGLSYNAFVRSSIKGSDHWKDTEKLWDSCNRSGDVYKKRYRGLYCVGCELFYTENELVDGYCPERHVPKPEIVEEENYFFRLSKYQAKLTELIEKDEIEIIPETRKAEALNFIKEGLEDFSISRSIKRSHGWGVPVPGDESQIIYVWFDALGIYLTGVGLTADEKRFKKYWPADLHVIGKGITRFHLIYWPAMLLSAGIDVPKGVFIHGYVTVDGQKMSKSLGNVVDPIEMLDKYGTDPIRYYLMKEISTFQDGDFSEKTLKDAINNELVGNLGNFVNRTLTFISSKFDGRIEEQELSDADKKFVGDVDALCDDVGKLMERNQLNVAILKILEISNMGNRYFQNSEPWKVIREDEKSARRILFVCANLCRKLGILIYPYMPQSSQRLLGYIGEKPAKFKNAGGMAKAFKVAKTDILFKKVE